MQAGGATAFCHVRGGGERGEASAARQGEDASGPERLARPHRRAGEALIARGVTTKKLLFIRGGSAGGITMGRAMEERPDLFAGVIDQVPDSNPLRSEITPGGPANIPEFGTVPSPREPYAALDHRPITGGLGLHACPGVAEHDRARAPRGSVGLHALLDSRASRHRVARESGAGSTHRAADCGTDAHPARLGRRDAAALQPVQSGRAVSHAACTRPRSHRSCGGPCARRRSALVTRVAARTYRDPVPR